MTRTLLHRSLLTLTLLCSTPGVAQTNNASEEPGSGAIENIVERSQWKKRDQPEFATIDAALVSRLNAINGLIDDDKLQEALTQLHDVLRRRLTEYPEAIVFQSIGYVHARLGDTDQSIEYFEKALASGALPSSQHQGVVYTVAHQYSARQEFDKSIALMTEWFQYEKDPFADAFMFTGSCFAALERYEDALPFVERAIEIADRPVESWYQMAVSLLVRLEKYEESIPLLKAMLEHWSQVPTYWEQLAGVYLEVGDDRAALDTTMVAYINGMVTSPQRILGLVELNMVHGIPLTAGEILEREMEAGVVPETQENLDQLIRIWIVAREYERATGAIDRVAPLADAGNYYMQAARLGVQAGDWAAAKANAQRALDAGYEDKVSAYMLMGAAHAEQGAHDQALEAFENIQEIGDEQAQDNAQKWIEFVQEAKAYESQLRATQ